MINITINIYSFLSNNSNFPEEWHHLIIYGYNTKYMISTHGRIYSFMTNKFLKPYESKRKNGKDMYLRVNLHIYNRDGKRCQKKFSIHRLVAKTFIPNIKNKPQVNHIDGNIFNNRVDNLEWSTAKENVIHAHKMKLTNPRKGSKHPNTIWKESDVKKICKCISKGYNLEKTFDKLQNKLSVSNFTFKKFKTMYYNLKQRKAWTYISDKYNF